MIYLSGTIYAQKHPRLGFIMTPDMGNRLPDAVKIAADNGCFTNPNGYSDVRYLKYLERMPRDRTMFATAPDVLGNHEETVKRSTPMLRQIRAMGLKSAFVAQDGWQNDTTPWDELDTLFVGGTTAFKFRGGRNAVAAAKARGKLAHMGRVNSLDRLRAAVGIGCDSADGTFLRFGPDTNWPRLKYWLDHLDEQQGMAV
jgi:hypothetical protein